MAKMVNSTPKEIGKSFIVTASYDEVEMKCHHITLSSNIHELWPINQCIGLSTSHRFDNHAYCNVYTQSVEG